MSKPRSIRIRGVKILLEEGVIEFVKKFVAYMVARSTILIFPYALFKIKTVSQHYDLNQLIGFASDRLVGLIKPLQIRDELFMLLNKLEGRKPNIVLEIGSANGGTLFLFSHIASEDSTIISIDLAEGKFGGGYPSWKIPLYKAFARKKQKIHLIRADSHSVATLENVKTLLNGRQIDFLFIDGDHSYYGIKKDFEMYISLVTRGGIIALHDIVPGPKEAVGGVPQFWTEIKDNYECEEIIKDWSQNGYGIGTIYV